MIRLNLSQVYAKIPKDIKKEVLVLRYKNHHTLILKDKYGLCTGNLANLQRHAFPNIKSALNKTKYFKQMLKEKFPLYENDYKVLGRFIRSSTPMLVSSEHGDCLISPDKLLRGSLPHIRNAINKSEYFVSVLKKKHENKYTYPNYVYKGPQSMLKIYCEKHGNFIQKSYIHLMGSGCQMCAEDNRVGGYSRSDFVKNAEGRVCTLYVIKCTKDFESFFKMGITMRSLKIRFREKKRMPYAYKIVTTVQTEDAGMIYNLEKQLFKTYKKDFSYRPLINFHGESECFNLSLPIEKIIEELKLL